MTPRWWKHLTTWLGVRSGAAVDPEAEIEAAIDEAREQDRVLRNEAARVVAHRAHLADEVAETSQQVAEAEDLAKNAVRKADQATRAGHAEEAERWSAAAQTIALRHQAAQRNVDALQHELVIADQQLRQAQTAIRNNALRLEELSAGRTPPISGGR